MSHARRLEGGIRRGDPVRVVVDGTALEAFAGETIACALLASGTRVMRQTARYGSFRGLFCGMGVCFDCMVTVDGRPNVRACITPVADGAVISTRRP